MKTILIFSLFLFTSISLPAQDFSRLSTSSEAQVLGYIQTEMADENMVGVSVGIIKNGEIVYLRGHGFEDEACNVSANANSLYRIASISKMFTAIAALQLWETGDLDLNEDIRTYVPEYPVKPQGTIRVADLLSNESGIQHYDQVDPYDLLALYLYIKDHPFDYDPIAAIDIFKNQPLLFTPGTQYNYSTWGFNLAAAVVERAGMAPFETQVKSRIADVADMPFFQPAFRSGMPFYNQATGYEEVNGVTQPDKGGHGDYDDVTYKLGGGGWICSVRDLTHFMKSYIDGQLLHDTTVAIMGTNHDPANGTNYGYGTFTAIRNGDTLLFHQGGQIWTSTLIYFSPENHNGVAIMTNNKNAATFPLARLLYDNISSYTLTNTSYNNPVPRTLGTPNLLFPADGSTQTNTSLPLAWRGVDYAQYYDYEVADNPNFSDAIQGRVKEKIAVINGLTENQTYYWRVKAVNPSLYGGTNGNWSGYYQFGTGSYMGLNVLPFEEGFERFHRIVYATDSNVYTGPGYRWAFEQENEVGRAKFGLWSITQKDGKGAMTLDALSTNGTIRCINFLTLTLNLRNYVNATDLSFAFDYMHHGEEENAEDRIWIRGRETDSWIEIYDWYANRLTEGVWKHVEGLDIDSVLAAHGQSPSAKFQLRIGQRDNSFASSASSLDGVTFDNLLIEGTPAPLALETIEAPFVHIYPNPASDFLQIKGIQGGKVTVIDAWGKKILEQNWAQDPIQIAHLAAGSYYVVIEVDQKIIVKPFVKKK